MSDLKRLQLRTQEDINYPNDVDKIVEDFRLHGYEITRKEAVEAWSLHSDTYSAGWLCGIEDEDTFYILQNYFIFDDNRDEII